METNLVPDFHSGGNGLVLDPTMSAAERDRWHRVAATGEKLLRGPHFLIPTSGTSGAAKLVALPKSAFRNSASSVNDHLRVEAKDVWLLALPTFHVGGMGILARVAASGTELVRMPESRGRPEWNPENFVQLARERRVTLTALVPTQVFDFVRLKLPSPGSLRAVVIGGAALDPQLYKDARALGWPLLPSFGMTESCSQVATASLDSLNQEGFPDLQLLSHAEIRVSGEGRLRIRGTSMLSAYIEGDGAGLRDPKDTEGFFESGDFGELSDRGSLRVSGRESDFVKIVGERVDLKALDRLLREFAIARGLDPSDWAVGWRASDRQGFEIVILRSENSEAAFDVKELRAAWAPKLRAFELPRDLLPPGSLKRSALGKIKRSVES